MSSFRPLIINNGTQSQLPNADSLLVGTGIDASIAGALTIGGTTATSITVGSAAITTNFPGPVTLTGDVTTVGGTTFTTDATFEGDVTFGNANTDTVDFVSKVDSDIVFTGVSATWQIKNLADPTLAQDAATKAYVDAATGAATLQTAYVNGNTITTSAGEGNVTIAGDQNLLITTSGQTGIGTATPNEKLTVNGVLSLANGTSPSNTASFGKLWAASANSTLNFFSNSVNYLITPNTVETITYAASVAIDFDPALPPLKSVTLTGDIAFTSSNLGASRNVSVRIIGDTVSRNLTSFPAGWTWLGGSVPTVLPANKTAILSLASFGSNDANVIASWSYDGSVNVTSVTASSPLASSGGTTPNISLTGTVAIANGGTGTTTAPTNGQLLIGNSGSYSVAGLTAGSGVTITPGAGSITIAATGSGGTVTSVDVSGGTTGLTTSGGPITGSGTITLAGTLDVDNGGTGQTSYTDGQLLIGNSTGNTLTKSTLTAGSGISITNGSGSITIAATSSATIGGSIANTQVAVGSGVNTISGSNAFTFASGTLTVNNGANAASPLVVQDNGTDVLTVGDNGTLVVKNTSNSATAYQMQNAAGTVLFNVDTTQQRVSVGTTGSTHTFNVGTGASANFCVASGGRIHTYDGSSPTDGQVLIGDTAGANFAKATLTAGTGISITNGAGSITLTATGAAAPVITMTTTGLTAGDIAYIASDNTAGAAIATAATTSRIAGFISVVGGAGVGKVQIGSTYTGANFITGLTGLAAGQPAFLSKTSGKLTNDVSAFTTGDVIAEIGLVVAVSSGTGGAAAADVLIQPKSIVVL